MKEYLFEGLTPDIYRVLLLLLESLLILVMLSLSSVYHCSLSLNDLNNFANVILLVKCFYNVSVDFEDLSNLSWPKFKLAFGSKLFHLFL